MNHRAKDCETGEISEPPDRKQKKKEKFVILLEERDTRESAAGFKMKNKRTSRDFLAAGAGRLLIARRTCGRKGFNNITTDVNGSRN